MIGQYRAGVSRKAPSRRSPALANATIRSRRGFHSTASSFPRASRLCGRSSPRWTSTLCNAPMEAGASVRRRSQPATSVPPCTPPPKRCGIATALLAPVLPQSAPQDLDAAWHDGACRIGAFRHPSNGRPATGAKDRRSLRRVSAHRNERGRGTMRALEEKATAEQAVLMGKKVRRPPKSPSTISPKWICAWGWCSPPSA